MEPRQRRHRELQEPAVGRAFTLVEMLVVIAIIGILVTIVIGVSGSVMRNNADAQTKMWIKVIRNALDVYYDAAHQYPTYDNEKAYDANNNALYKLLAMSDSDEWGTNTDPEGRSKAKARQMVRGLPKNATLYDEAEGKWYFIDAYRQKLRYIFVPIVERNYRPYLESSGADLNFGDPDSTDQQEKNKTEDNIRSDRL